MNIATTLFSRAGYAGEKVKATDFRSHEDARKYWPLLSEDGTELVCWVKSAELSGGRRGKRHFRRLPSFYQRTSLVKTFELIEEKRQKRLSESLEHKQAKELLCQELQKRIASNIPKEWFFKDRFASEFSFTGDLLFGAVDIKSEMPIKTGFGPTFKLDIGIIGPTLKNKPSCIGGIELEYRNQFDGRKALLSRSLGFPLISVDISGLSLNDITPQWAQSILSKTTNNSEDGLRKTYIYLPTSLYPLYVNAPEHLYKVKDTRHQYLAFAKKEILKKLEEWLVLLRSTLGYFDSDINITILNEVNETAKIQLENAGNIAGKDWRDYSDGHCLRVSLFRPRHDKNLLRNHLFHITMARMFAEQDVLLGYKYALGNKHLDPDVHLWILDEWNKEQRKNTPHQLLPKRLATPILPILKKIENIRKNK